MLDNIYSVFWILKKIFYVGSLVIDTSVRVISVKFIKGKVLLLVVVENRVFIPKYSQKRVLCKYSLIYTAIR